MLISWEIINSGFNFLIEGGSAQSVPEQKEWLGRFPQSSPDEYAKFIEVFRNIEQKAIELGERRLDCELDCKEACDLLAKEYPKLSEAAIDWVIGRGTHFASK